MTDKEQTHTVWRSVPMGPLVMGDSDYFVTYTTRRDCPYEARRGDALISRHSSVAGAMSACEAAQESGRV